MISVKTLLKRSVGFGTKIRTPMDRANPLKGGSRRSGGHYERRKFAHVVLRPDKSKMEKRKCTSEHPFGTIKRTLNGGFLPEVQFQGE